MSPGTNSHELQIILTQEVYRSKELREMLLTFEGPLISSKPDWTVSTIRLMTAAYFLPCSPSNTTPECRIIVAGVERERSMYPRTERWEVMDSRLISRLEDVLPSLNSDTED
jgi:hypothetical protein